MSAEVTAREFEHAARRAPTAAAEVRWLVRALLEQSFAGDGRGLASTTLRLVAIARRSADPVIRYAAYAADGLLAAAARDRRAGPQLERAASLFAIVPAPTEVVWVELQAQVLMGLSRCAEVPRLLGRAVASRPVGSADHQRLLCTLGLAELGRGDHARAAAAFHEASLAPGLVDVRRCDWAAEMMRTAAAAGGAELSDGDLRVLVADEEGLSVAATARRLDLSSRDIEFLRAEVGSRLGRGRHRHDPAADRLGA